VAVRLGGFFEKNSLRSLMVRKRLEAVEQTDAE